MWQAFFISLILEVGIMKKKICFLLTLMIMVMVLTCACSAGAKEEEPAITPDLNRNGIAEEVRLTDLDDGQGQRLEIWENNELIDFEEGYYAHAGYTSIFLCTLEGEDYL